MTTLAELLGSQTEAQRWMASRTRGLVLWNRLSEDQARAVVERAVAEHDPTILAALGQVWTRRAGADPALPEVLYLTHWLGRHHLAVEDGCSGIAVIRLLDLRAYELGYWRRS